MVNTEFAAIWRFSIIKKNVFDAASSGLVSANISIRNKQGEKNGKEL